jgi:DNA-binding NtrC family response regulator
MVNLRRDIAVAAGSNTKVLITGESGVGKDITARAIHQRSTRRSRPFRANQLFERSRHPPRVGALRHLRGSFTGAVRDHQGIFESAHRGTVVLDEIGDSSARMQGLLLRVCSSASCSGLVKVARRDSLMSASWPRRSGTSSNR